MTKEQMGKKMPSIFPLSFVPHGECNLMAAGDMIGNHNMSDTSSTLGTMLDHTEIELLLEIWEEDSFGEDSLEESSTQYEDND